MMMHLTPVLRRARRLPCHCAVMAKSMRLQPAPACSTQHVASRSVSSSVGNLPYRHRSHVTAVSRTYDNGRERSHDSALLSSSAAVTAAPFPADFPLVQFSRTSRLSLGGEDASGDQQQSNRNKNDVFVTVVPDVISVGAEQALMRDLDPVFARKRYERGHWDSVIEDYKESERLDGSWSPRCQQIVDSIRTLLAQRPQEGISGGEPTSGVAGGPWLPVHAIDLSPQGFIRPHVDSVKFSGGVVAGLSLMSSAVMQLTRAADSDLADLLLPPRSLYILRGPARFEWKHAILPNDGEPIKWHGREFPRGRRVSLIFRDELIGPAPEPHPSSVAGISGTF